MISKIQKLLKDNELWIFYTDEGSDKYFKKYISPSVVGLAVAFVSNKFCKVLVSGLDEKNVDFEKVIYNSGSEFESLFVSILKGVEKPVKIYLNFGNTAQIDVLGHGSFLKLSRLLTECFGAENLNLDSAIDLIYKIEDSNSRIDEKYFKLSARRANEILAYVFKNLKSGMSEKEIAKLTQEQLKTKPEYFKEYNITDETFSWEAPCPIVLVGKNLKLGGHTSPSETILKKGDTIYFDFGVKITANGKEYCSDIQRMGYVLKEGEEYAPSEVQKVFDVLTYAISEGQKIATTKTKGFEVDEKVRSIILANGYPDYNHGTGHAVKDGCHAVGTRLSKKGVMDTDRFLQHTGIYTIEPRIMIENGGSIEEMIIVKKGKSEFVSPRQTELYLIKD